MEITRRMIFLTKLIVILFICYWGTFCSRLSSRGLDVYWVPWHNRYLTSQAKLWFSHQQMANQNMNLTPCLRWRDGSRRGKIRRLKMGVRSIGLLPGSLVGEAKQGDEEDSSSCEREAACTTTLRTHEWRVCSAQPSRVSKFILF